MNSYIIWGIMSIFLFFISWRTVFDVQSHGFYRFFTSICIAWLLVHNAEYWFVDPLSVNQVISWTFLHFSVMYVIISVRQMKKFGKPSEERREENLFHFEKTTELIDKGLFKYIRHPMYASLLFFIWGTFFKRMDVVLLAVSVLGSLFIFLTCYFEEKENINYFGEDAYMKYKKRTKMFIPYIL